MVLRFSCVLSICCVATAVGCLSASDIPQRDAVDEAADDGGVGDAGDSGPVLPYPHDPPPEGCELEDEWLWRCYETDTCDRACVPLVCGDRKTDEDEECDDGNDNPLDGCDSCKQYDLGKSFLYSANYFALFKDQVYGADATLLVRKEIGRVTAWAVAHGFADGPRSLRLSPDGENLCASSDGFPDATEVGKWTSGGELVWKVTVDDEKARYSDCYLDGDGNVFVVSSQFVQKLVAADGAPAWPPIYDLAPLRGVVDADGALRLFTYEASGLGLARIAADGTYDATKDVHIPLGDPSISGDQVAPVADGGFVLLIGKKASNSSKRSWSVERYDATGKRLWLTKLFEPTTGATDASVYALESGVIVSHVDTATSTNTRISRVAVLDADGKVLDESSTLPVLYGLAQEASGALLTVAYRVRENEYETGPLVASIVPFHYLLDAE